MLLTLAAWSCEEPTLEESAGAGGAGGGSTSTTGATTSSMTLSCTEDAICPTVEVDEPCSYCSSHSCRDDGSEPSAEDVAVRCTLEALRDRRSGRVAVRRGPDASSFCGDIETVTIIEDGSAFRRHFQFQDMTNSEYAFPIVLRPASYFQQCLDAGPTGALECLRSSDWYASWGAGGCLCPFCVSDPGF